MSVCVGLGEKKRGGIRNKSRLQPETCLPLFVCLEADKRTTTKLVKPVPPAQRRQGNARGAAPEAEAEAEAQVCPVSRRGVTRNASWGAGLVSWPCAKEGKSSKRSPPESERSALHPTDYGAWTLERAGGGTWHDMTCLLGKLRNEQ